ncbi:MAG: ribbon-helix-helix protein, CopG family [Anaerotignum sp.]|nr:ribbon-helix-helix protein, CopG family [Anaerotignum sp.]
MANFIPKPYKTEQVTIRLPLDRLAQVDELATKYNLSRSAFINQCVDYALENLLEMEIKNEE